METKAYGIISPQDKERDEIIKELLDAVYMRNQERVDSAMEKIRGMGDKKLLLDAEYFIEISNKYSL